MLDAAETLFTRNGYAATTVTAIADEADMAVQTVYAVFGTKRAILAELVDTRVVGGDPAGSLPDREDWQAMERESEPHRQIELFASIATRIARRSAAINEVMAAAAGADPEIAALYDATARGPIQRPAPPRTLAGPYTRAPPRATANPSRRHDLGDRHHPHLPRPRPRTRMGRLTSTNAGSRTSSPARY